MIHFLFDTNHASQFFQDFSPLKKKVQQHRGDHFGLCAPVVAALWFMVYNSKKVDENKSKLEAILKQFETWPLDPAATEIFGRVKPGLRRAGKTVADIDLLIASITLANDLTVLTADTAFANVPNLKHENWLI